MEKYLFQEIDGRGSTSSMRVEVVVRRAWNYSYLHE